MSGSSSMFILTSLSSPARSSAIRSRIGETAWHGPHHSAQKSTRTGVSDWSTSCSNVVVVTASAIPKFLSDSLSSLTLALVVLFPGDRRIEHDGPDVPLAPLGPGSLRTRAGDPGLVGREGYLRKASRPE